MRQGCCLGFLLYQPYAFVRWCLYQGWKGYIVLAVVAIILIVGAVQFHSCVFDRDGGGSSNNNIPSKLEAPYKVETYSRVYLAREAEKDKATGDVTMVTYWELLGDTWTKHEVTFVLDAESYGVMLVSKR